MDNANEKEANILPQPQGGIEQQGINQGLPGSVARTEGQANPEAANGVSSVEKSSTPPVSSQVGQNSQTQTQQVGDNTAATSQAQSAAAAILQDVPDIADDSDLIEKEWVAKVKQIVDQTKHDPHNQNNQIVRLRADYLKKRYNKDIKMDKS